MDERRLQQHWVRYWKRGKDVIQVVVTVLDPETNEALATVITDVGPFDVLEHLEHEALVECFRLLSGGIPGQQLLL
jgi:hypothetical protein